MPTKKLQSQIEKKLNQLQELIDNIDNARAINSDDPKTWDSDTLYDLVEQLKETLQLLEKISKKIVKRFSSKRSNSKFILV